MTAIARLLPLLLCLAGFLSLAGCSPRTPAKVPPPRQFDQPSSLDGLTFATPQLEEALQSFTQAIDKIADEKWEQKGWHKLTYDYYRYRQWCSEPGVMELLKEPLLSKQPKGSYYLLRLTVAVGSRDSPTEIRGVSVDSSWQGTPGNWGARVVYPIGGGKAPYTDSELTFVRGQSPYPQSGVEFIATNAWLDDYAGGFNFGGVDYVANIRTRADHHWQAVSLPDLLRWYDSADHFHEDWMARLTRLEEKAKVDIPSGAAISQGESDKPDQPTRQGFHFPLFRSTPAIDFRPSGREMANVPPPPRFPSSRKTTPAEREEVLKKALEVIGGRKKQLDAEYQELHTALVKALPLVDYLREKMKNQE